MSEKMPPFPPRVTIEFGFGGIRQSYTTEEIDPEEIDGVWDGPAHDYISVGERDADVAKAEAEIAELEGKVAAAVEALERSLSGLETALLYLDCVGTTDTFMLVRRNDVLLSTKLTREALATLQPGQQEGKRCPHGVFTAEECFTCTPTEGSQEGKE